MLIKFTILACLFLATSLLGFGQIKTSALVPVSVDSGDWTTAHMQGIAVDDARQFIYYSFTTMLVKTDMSGKLIGTVTGLQGTHLGDLAFHDGKVYASLEYKEKKAFYIAIFDTEKITELDMPYDTAGLMTTVFVHEAADDFVSEKYGCSGIDGVAIGTSPGSDSDEMKLMVGYGIFSDTKRSDNDHQILLEYDLSRLSKENAPFDPEKPHKIGARHAEKYFIYTGNTTFGIQNLEYDVDSEDYWMAVYKGKKSAFPNYPLYLIDGSEAPVRKAVKGQEKEETGLFLSLKKAGVHHEPSGVYGFPTVPVQPATGFISLGDDFFYLAESGSRKEGQQYGIPTLFALDRKTFEFTPVSKRK